MYESASRVVRRGVALATVGVVLAACGAGSNEAEGDAAGTTAPAVSLVPESTVPIVTSVTPGTQVPSPVSTSPAGPLMPLTGLPVADAAAARRPALVVKIDNGPLARPQSGLNQADVVFEENVEQITRFAAVYHSELPDPVGPIRSGRTQDIELLGSFNGPLFAWSGGNSVVTAAVRASDLRDVGALTSYGPGGYFRSSSRTAPHNLFASGRQLITLAPEDAGPPPPQFTYRPPSDAPLGDPVRSVKLSMDGVRVEWSWDQASERFLRSQGGDPHLGADGVRVDADNVVVMFMVYRTSAADSRSPEAVSLGEGSAWILSAGRWVDGTWTRDAVDDPFELTDASGAVVPLTPGRTWVQLVRKDKAAIVPAGVDPAGVPYP